MVVDIVVDGHTAGVRKIERAFFQKGEVTFADADGERERVAGSAVSMGIIRGRET